MIPYRGLAQHFNRTVFSRRLPPRADYYSVKKAFRPLLPGYVVDYREGGTLFCNLSAYCSLLQPRGDKQLSSST